MLISCAVAALVFGAAGCSDSGKADDSAGTSKESTSTTTETTTPVNPEPEPEPEPNLIETNAVGQLISLPSADITVRTIEERDEIPSSYPEMTEDFVAQDGNRLWFFDIEWTNNTNEAVTKECHGPDMMNLRVYDINGVEMLMVDQPGMIEGQECTTGLMKGETGTWMTAFTGPDSDFGWAVFEDYAGDQAVVTLDPDLELVSD